MLNILMNDNYKLLCCLSENKITVNESEFVPLTQQEISKLMNFSLMKTNKIMAELKANGFIKLYNNTKGRYMLTNEASLIIKELNEIRNRTKKEID